MSQREELNSADVIIISAFKSVERKNDGVADETVGQFRALTSPEQLRRTYENVFTAQGGINTSSEPAKYSRSKPQELQLKLILDGTGIMSTGRVDNASATPKGVRVQVDDFLALCHEYKGDTHEPNYLKLNIGNLETFACRLVKVDVVYSVFNQSGTPLRAELEVTFVEDISPADRAKKENKQSPDLTHAVMFKAGDTLPLLAARIYGDATLYLRLAEFNEIDHFREITPGTELRFPPLPSLTGLKTKS